MIYIYIYIIIMNKNYFIKYLKYKKKYLNLKGGAEESNCKELNSILTNNVIGTGLESLLYLHKTDDTKCLKRYIILKERKLGAWSNRLNLIGGGYTKKDFIDKKLKPMILLMENNLGPTIYKVYYCDKYVYVLMDRINGKSLDELKDLTDYDNIIDIFKKKLKELGIDSSDFHKGNIMKNESGDYLIVDW